jgi:uncharacterized protein
MSDIPCGGCGCCCRTFPIFVAYSDAEREPRIASEGYHLPKHLQQPDWAYKLYPLPFHERCCFLTEQNACTIHPTRPQVCRDFNPGDDQCDEARERNGLPPLGK